jgi:hypothetical protein
LSQPRQRAFPWFEESGIDMGNKCDRLRHQYAKVPSNGLSVLVKAVSTWHSWPNYVGQRNRTVLTRYRYEHVAKTGNVSKVSERISVTNGRRNPSATGGGDGLGKFDSPWNQGR